MNKDLLALLMFIPVGFLLWSVWSNMGTNIGGEDE